MLMEMEYDILMLFFLKCYVWIGKLIFDGKKGMKEVVNKIFFLFCY